MRVGCSRRCSREWAHGYALLDLRAQGVLTRATQLVGRVGPSCTHIVFKNGLMSTITKWR
jgi:hypothetical protein